MSVLPPASPRFGSRFRFQIDQDRLTLNQSKVKVVLDPLTNAFATFAQDLGTAPDCFAGANTQNKHNTLYHIKQVGLGLRNHFDGTLDIVVLDVLDKLFLKHLNVALAQAGLTNQITPADAKPGTPEITQGNLDEAKLTLKLENNLPFMP